LPALKKITQQKAQMNIDFEKMLSAVQAPALHMKDVSIIRFGEHIENN